MKRGNSARILQSVAFMVALNCHGLRAVACYCRVWNSSWRILLNLNMWHVFLKFMQKFKSVRAIFMQ